MNALRELREALAPMSQWARRHLFTVRGVVMVSLAVIALNVIGLFTSNGGELHVLNWAWIFAGITGVSFAGIAAADPWGNDPREALGVVGGVLGILLAIIFFVNAYTIMFEDYGANGAVLVDRHENVVKVIDGSDIKPASQRAIKFNFREQKLEQKFWVYTQDGKAVRCIVSYSWALDKEQPQALVSQKPSVYTAQAELSENIGAVIGVPFVSVSSADYASQREAAEAAVRQVLSDYAAEHPIDIDSSEVLVGFTGEIR